MDYKKRVKKIVKKGISISGALASTLIGMGTTILIFLSFKNKKTPSGDSMIPTSLSWRIRL